MNELLVPSVALGLFIVCPRMAGMMVYVFERSGIGGGWVFAWPPTCFRPLS